jgi:DNA-binding IscR family transcriptional regulator
MPDSQVVKCAKCDVPLEGPANPDSQDRLACPNCGIGDTFENVSAEINEYIGEQLVAALARQTEAAFSKSKNMKLTQTPSPQKSYRFIVNFEPPH